MTNPYETSSAPAIAPPSPSTRWLYFPAALCIASAVWFATQLIILDRAYATMTGGDDTIRSGMLLMAALNNVVSLIAIFAAIFSARLALWGRWVIALVIPLLGYMAILFAGRFVAPYLFDWYIARSYGV
jgi:hypothetical protein